MATKSISTVALAGCRAGAEIHRWAEIEQEPGGDFAVLDVLADVGRVHARGDIPVDVADVVLGLVFAQVGKVDPVAVEQAAIIALQQAVQPADDLPVQALQDALRRLTWLGIGAFVGRGTSRGARIRSRIFLTRISRW